MYFVVLHCGIIIRRYGGNNMKKMYTVPTAEKVSFCYKEQVVASGGEVCYGALATGEGGCQPRANLNGVCING